MTTILQPRQQTTSRKNTIELQASSSLASLLLAMGAVGFGALVLSASNTMEASEAPDEAIKPSHIHPSGKILSMHGTYDGRAVEIYVDTYMGGELEGTLAIGASTQHFRIRTPLVEGGAYELEVWNPLTQWHVPLFIHGTEAYDRASPHLTSLDREVLPMFVEILQSHLDPNYQVDRDPDAKFPDLMSMVGTRNHAYWIKGAHAVQAWEHYDHPGYGACTLVGKTYTATPTFRFLGAGWIAMSGISFCLHYEETIRAFIWQHLPQFKFYEREFIDCLKELEANWSSCGKTETELPAPPGAKPWAS